MFGKGTFDPGNSIISIEVSVFLVHNEITMVIPQAFAGKMTTISAVFISESRQVRKAECMAKEQILIAEDDADIRSVLRLYLQSEGYTVLEADNGAAALELAQANRPDLAILDIMMPKMNGFELIRELRTFDRMPILILSAKSGDNDKILGLNLGADDYIAKPFNPLEIMARVRALLRRSGGSSDDTLTVRDLTLDTKTFSLTKRGEQVLLTPTEYKILAQLMRAPGRIFTKVQLYEGISGEFFESDDNTMMVHISKLRDKVEDDPKKPAYIITVRGLGYKIER